MHILPYSIFLNFVTKLFETKFLVIQSGFDMILDQYSCKKVFMITLTVCWKYFDNKVAFY